MKKHYRIRSITPDDRTRVIELLCKNWGTPEIVSRGKIHDASALPGFVAISDSEEILGLITLHPENDACEVVTLDAFVQGQGVGKSLLNAGIHFSKSRSLRRLWLITTNDNVNALGFYQKAGMRITKVHIGAIDESRKLKPQIPLVADNGIPIKDEIELEMQLGEAD